MSKPNAREQRYLNLIRSLPCACCGQPGPNSAHHLREDMGIGQKNRHHITIPLCYECHQGVSGVHGDKALMRVYKKSELIMLDETIAKLVMV